MANVSKERRTADGIAKARKKPAGASSMMLNLCREAISRIEKVIAAEQQLKAAKAAFLKGSRKAGKSAGKSKDRLARNLATRTSEYIRRILDLQSTRLFPLSELAKYRQAQRPKREPSRKKASKR